MQRLGTVFCGGFFDHFHGAHRAAMARVAQLECRQVIILVASDKRVREKKKPVYELTQPEKVRLKRVIQEAKKARFKSPVVIRLTHHSIDPEILTHPGRIAIILNYPADGQKVRSINRQRQKNALPPARVITWKRSPIPISSSEIRRVKLEAQKNKAKRPAPRQNRRRGH